MLKTDEGKPVMEVQLSKSELKKVGEFEGTDNVEALRRLVESIPKIIPIPRRVKEGTPADHNIGKSLKTLAKIADWKATNAERNAGSSTVVVIKNEEGEVVHRASPPSPALVEELRERVARIKKSVSHDYPLVGVEQGEVDGILGKIDKAFETYEQVFDLRRGGKSSEEVKRLTGLSDREQSSWLSGKRTPDAIYRRDPEYRGKISKPPEIPSEYSTSLAYVLGAYAGVTRHETYNERLQFAHTDASVMERLHDAINDAFKRDVRLAEGTSRYGKLYYDLVFVSKPVAMYFNGITQGNTQLPWEHLVTKEERVAFMHGFFDFTGGVSKSRERTKDGFVYHPRIDAQKLNNEGLVKEMAVLLKSIGMLPAVQLGRRATLHILDQKDLAKFMEEYGGFTSPEIQAKIKKLYGHGYARAEYTAEEYFAATEYKEQHPEATTREVSRAVGIEYDTVRSWLARGTKPRSIGKIETIRDFEREIPDPDVIGLMFREYGFDSELSRDIAGKLDINDLKAGGLTAEGLKARQRTKGDMQFLVGLLRRDDGDVREKDRALKLIGEPLGRILQQKFNVEIPREVAEDVEAREAPAPETVPVVRPKYAYAVDTLVMHWTVSKDSVQAADSLARREARKWEIKPAEVRDYILGRLAKGNFPAQEQYRKATAIREEVAAPEIKLLPYAEAVDTFIKSWNQLEAPADAAEMVAEMEARKWGTTSREVRKYVLAQLENSNPGGYNYYKRFLEIRKIRGIDLQ